MRRRRIGVDGAAQRIDEGADCSAGDQPAQEPRRGNSACADHRTAEDDVQAFYVDDGLVTLRVEQLSEWDLAEDNGERRDQNRQHEHGHGHGDGECDAEGCRPDELRVSVGWTPAAAHISPRR